MRRKDREDHSRITKLLLELGFSARQASVYLALLELGKGTVSEIARKAGINRTTGYDILASLIEKRLASASGKEPKQEYTAESPDHLLMYLKRESKKAGAREHVAEKIIPELKSIHNAFGKPRVMFYEGTDGLERAYEDTLTTRETILAYANVEDMHGALPHYFPRYYRRRVDRGISVKVILPANSAGKERVRHNAEELREAALVPAEKYFFSPEINIYDDKIMIASWREKLGIIIQSKEIAEAMKSIFRLAWEEAKRTDEGLGRG